MVRMHRLAVVFQEIRLKGKQWSRKAQRYFGIVRNYCAVTA